MTEATKLEPSDEVVEGIVAAAVRDYDGCGLQINGRRAFCDDPEADPGVMAPGGCTCRGVARAAIAAYQKATALDIRGEARTESSPAPAVPSGWRLVPESTLSRLKLISVRMRMRLDAIVERDGSVDAAIKGNGMGIGYLFSKEIADACYAAISPNQPSPEGQGEAK